MKVSIFTDEAVSRITELLIRLAAEENESREDATDSDTKPTETLLEHILIKRRLKVEYQIRKLVLDILTYCNRRDFPEPLIYSCAEYLKGRMDKELAGEGGIPLKRLKQDDTEFEWAVENVDILTLSDEEFLKALKSKLYLYRKVKSL